MIKSPLPNFFILGAAKAGTTTLFDLLKQHPQIYFPYNKEPLFFCRDEFYEYGLDWYARSFFSGSEKFAIRGEASPHYLYWAEKVAPRIKQAISNEDLKFIVVLRNPTERAYSWYWNMIKDGRETLSFVDALEAEEERLQKNKAQLSAWGSMNYGYYRGGQYLNQIKEFLKYFPRENLHVVLFDDLIKTPTEVLKDVFNFLNIASDVVIEPIKSNSSAMPRSKSVHELMTKPSVFKQIARRIIPSFALYYIREMIFGINLEKFSYPQIDKETEALLKHRYTKEVNALGEFLQRDLSNWNKI
jgi:hypothetical protein